jgi:hypothetical protein
MFFEEKEERNNTPQPNKYNDLSDRFKSCVTTSLIGINPIELCWSTPDLHNIRILSVEMHPTYIETLENIEQFINEIKLERSFRNRLSPAEKEKVIEAFIIPLYEHKKAIYANAIDYIYKCMTKFQQHRHPHKYQKEMNSKYLDIIEECHRQINACDESISDCRPTLCVGLCAIL